MSRVVAPASCWKFGLGGVTIAAMNLTIPSRTTFAGTLMALIGALQALAGLALVRDGSPFSVSPRGTSYAGRLFALSDLTWGWLHLIAGAALALVGLSLGLRDRRPPWPTIGVGVTFVAGLVALAAPFDVATGELVLFYLLILWALTTDPDAPPPTNHAADSDADDAEA
jgi:uncharacterized membrane protein HdeD (DUF308 family)